MKIKQRILPVEYQEVEYLESHGTECIDTGLLASDVNTFEIKASMRNIEHGDNAYLIGARNYQKTAISWCEHHNSHGGLTYYPMAWQNNNIGVEITYDEIFTLKSTIKANYASLTINGILKHEDTTTLRNYEDSYTISLYALHESANYIYKSVSRIYYCKAYLNNVLKSHFVPCYRKSNNKPGLYELVNGVFYTNAGTGKFTVGADVVTVDSITISEGSVTRIADGSGNVMWYGAGN